jgi:sugar lactone lactonase YvrE
MKIKKIMVVLFAVALTASMFAGNKSIPKYPRVTVRTLVQGAPIHGANGIYFGPDGKLYIASAGGNEIIKMDPNSGRILDRINAATPDDLTFGPDGLLYYTAIVSGEVHKIAPDGTTITIATVPPGVNPITFSSDGRLFVALDFFGSAGLYELDPNGAQLPKLILGGWDVYNLNAFDFGPDGCLYGPIYSQKVVKIDVNAKTMVDILTGIAPSAVKFDTLGRLYTNDNNTGRVLRYNFGDWENGRVLATVPYSMDNLAIDSRNQVYVSGDADGYIAKILPHGKYIMLSPGGMINPNGVAVLPRVDGGESVYVADEWSLREFDGRTGKEHSVAKAGIVSAGLTPFLGALAPDGSNLIVSAPYMYVIQEYDPVGQQVLSSSIDGNMPLAAIRFGNSLVASELMTGQVMNLSSTEVLGQFYVPYGLATNGTELWVADYAAGTVSKILPNQQTIAWGLSGPTGLAYYPPDGSLLVVEATAGKLSRIDLLTNVVTTLAEGLQVGFAFGFIDGVAVGPSGAIYVAGSKANVLYRIEIDGDCWHSGHDPYHRNKDERSVPNRNR